jgi:hypothetical protein
MAALTSNPLQDPAAFDVIVVAGVVNPGLVRVTGADRVFDWDVKDAPGSQGSTITYRGWKPTDSIQLRFEFWEQEQINDFYTNFVPLFYYDANKTAPKPVDVFHPILNANQINSVVTKKIGPLVLEDKQLYSCTIEVLEYRPAPKKNATTTPKASAATDPEKAAAKSPIEDALDRRIEQLRRQGEIPQPVPDAP